MKRYLLYAAIIYLVFVVYGSLVPLNFNNIPLSEAWQRFENIRFLNLKIASRADWVANILLFIPLAFFWTGVMSQAVPGRKVLITIVVAFLCAMLCICIEFTQLFFPPRTVSLNDILAESMGTVIGISVWWFLGKKFLKWLDEWYLSNSSDDNVDKYLQIYLAGLFFYNVMPLDLTISPVEIYHKWNQGRVILFPFTGLKEEFVENLYEWFSEILLWIPVPVLWQRKNRGLSKLQIWGKVFFAVVAIEFFQLFVFSRVTDVTDIILAMVGGWLGLWFGQNFIVSNVDDKRKLLGFSQTKILLIGGVSYILWCFVLMLVFWYPFDFKWDSDLIKWKFNGFFNIPFYSYYYGTEYRAITEVIHKTLFFLPLGGIISFSTNSFSNRSAFFWLALFIISSSALTIEIVQVLLPEKTISSTDVLLEIIGGFVGYIIGRQFFQTQLRESEIYRASQRRSRSSQAQEDFYIRELDSRNKVTVKQKMNFYSRGDKEWLSWLILFLGLIVCSAGILIASQSSFVPYNIKELVQGDHVFFRSIGLSLSVFWCFGFPVWFLYQAIKRKINILLSFIYAIGIHALIAWLLIRMAVPLESIHDIVGSPILSFSAELELFFRFIALFSIFSVAIIGSVLFILNSFDLNEKLGGYWVCGFVVAVILLPICYWVVVIAAATDNLTELLANEGRSFSVIGVFFYFFILGCIGSCLSASMVCRRIRMFVWAMGLLLLSFPLGYGLLNWATEPIIYKYGAAFSALQFLLSPDRSHLVTGVELFSRFCLLNIVLLITVCFIQYSFWLQIPCKKK